MIFLNALYFPFKNIIVTDKLTGIHALFHRVFKIAGHKLLYFSILLWLLCPILGLPLLLIYSQSALSNKIYKGKKVKVNLWLIMLTIFTITVFSASIYIQSDVESFVNYFRIIQRSSLDYASKTYDFEPGSFVLPTLLSFGEVKDHQWFLLIQSFTFNLLFTIYSIFLIPEIYPVLIILNITSPAYFYQLFLMRQLYAMIFIIPAFCTSKNWLKIILIFLAIMTHSSSIIFVIPLFSNYLFNLAKALLTIFNVKNFFSGKIILLMSFAFIFILFNLSYPLLVSGNLFGFNTFNLLGFNTFTESRSTTLEYLSVSDNITFSFSLGPTGIVNLCIFITSLKVFLDLESPELNDRLYFSWIAYLLLFLLLMFTLNFYSLTGLNLIGAIFIFRPTYYFIALVGVLFFPFFLSGIFREAKLSSSLIIFSLTFLILAGNFTYYLIRMQQRGSSAIDFFQTVFWNGHPLSANILDYYLLFQKALLGGSV